MARCSNIETAVTESMRIGWRTVGGIIERIQVEIDGQVDRLAGFERIEIDEISYERQTWNGAELARSLAVSEPTVRRYLDALSDALVFRQLQPWHT
ncbi:MAG: HTH domain-containing protein, partial [Candidatus Microthrix sp.]|nr:HTH domain-containing protein [Candidatus Microthrix sp.]